MIEYLQGVILSKSPTHLLLLCRGVGYGVNISISTSENLGGVGDEAAVHTYLAVRDDAMTLFGFATVSERDLFLKLTGVTGIGPKTALGMLSGMGVDQLVGHIASGRHAPLTSLPGIGKKSAERVVLELRDKLGGIATGSAETAGGDSHLQSEAVSALVALGYSRSVAERGVNAALNESPKPDDLQGLIKAALRQLS